MGLLGRAVFATSVAYAYFFSPTRSTFGFLGSFLTAWAIQIFCYVVWIVVLYPKFFSPLRHLPQPSGNSFFMGQFSRILAEPSGVPMLEWINSIPNDGIIRFLGFFNFERILLASPRALGEVLVTKNYDFVKPPEFRYGIGRVIGIGLLISEGGEHKHQRRSLLPAFAFRHIKDLVPLFWDKSREGVQAMVDDLLKDAVEPPQNLSEEKLGDKTALMEVGNWASRITLDIIGLTGLGRDFQAIKDPNNKLTTMYNSLFKPSKQGQLLSILQLLIYPWMVNYLPLKRNYDIMEATAYVRGVCRELITEKRRKLATKELDDLDILSVALESGGFTDDNLVDHMMTFLAAGHETTASAMTWAVYLLSIHPEVQDRLRAEVRAKLPSVDDMSATVSAADIDHMPYLNAVCNEILRYYAPAPLSVRVAAVDTTICDQHVPKGTRIMIVPWAVNKSVELWGPDADKFNPDRWLPYFDGDKGAASGHATSNYAFLTFFHGPRACIGQSFAKTEFACLVAAWVGKLKFELKNEEEKDEKNLKIKGMVTARLQDGLWVKATVLDWSE